MSQLTIRTATPEDAKCITEFSWRLAFETESLELNRSTLRQGVDALLNDPGKGVYFLAEQDGVAIGQTAITTEWSDWRNGYWWWIQSVYIHADHRGSGVFRALYQHILQQARNTPDVVGLRLYVDRSNQAAQQTYYALGMQASHYDFFEAPFSLSSIAS